LPGGTVRATNVSLSALILWTYGVRSNQLAGAAPWLDSERYDVLARPGTAATYPETMEMLKPLLAERFHLAIHRETREAPVFSLVVSKGGLKLQPNADTASAASQNGWRTAPNMLIGTAKSMSQLASALTGPLGRTVIDNTGLMQMYDILLKWKPEDDATDGASPPIFIALQEQLGLQVQSSKAPVEMLVIDHAWKPPAN
jgi:uncharacterized protein (TIGR03435 family)